ncbi:MAG: SIMPL domain-containing protein [Candidatus Parcubacteria bacterium]|nr:SIMPL domain-containing protein [Candidatus Parcubacteria bacterium]
MEILFKNKRFVNVIIILLFSASLFLLGLFLNGVKQYSFIGRDIPALTTISVTGESEVFVKPDVVELSFSVSKDAKTVGEAQKTSTEKTNEIISYLKEMKIDDADIKTTDYSVYPKYEYQRAVSCLGMMNGYCPDGKQILVGYTVNQTVDIKVRKIDDAGKILVAIGDKGATNVSGLNFTIDKKKEVEADARNKAIQDAQKKADVLAKNLGVKLTRVINFSEGQAPTPYYGMGGGMMKTASFAIAEDTPAPSIPVGENKFTSNVTITYEIQ